jgi:hypothetical protein
VWPRMLIQPSAYDFGSRQRGSCPGRSLHLRIPLVAFIAVLVGRITSTELRLGLVEQAKRIRQSLLC